MRSEVSAPGPSGLRSGRGPVLAYRRRDADGGGGPRLRGRGARAGRVVRASARTLARPARDVLAEGLHPAHAPLPGRLPLLHVRAPAATRRALLPDARTRCSRSPTPAGSRGATKRCSRSVTSPSCATAAARDELDRLGFARPRPTWRSAPASCCVRPVCCRTPTPAFSTTTSCRACARWRVAGHHARDGVRAPVGARRAALRLARQGCPTCAWTRSTRAGRLRDPVHQRHPDRHRRDARASASRRCSRCATCTSGTATCRR